MLEHDFGVGKEYLHDGGRWLKGVADVKRQFQIAPASFNVVVIELQGVATAQEVTLAARGAVVHTFPLAADKGFALVGSGIGYVGRQHRVRGGVSCAKCNVCG